VSGLPEWRSAYIDETGDRGTGPRASPIFGMASVILGRDAERRMVEAVSTLRSRFDIPEGKVMSWKDHIKGHHGKARYAASVLGAVPGVTLVYAACFKKDLTYATFQRTVEGFYDHMAYHTLRLTCYAASYVPPTGKRLRVRFGQVKGHESEPTRKFLKAQKDAHPGVHWDTVERLDWTSAEQYPCSQAADLYAGFLKAAIWPDEWANSTEGQYLKLVWHQIRKKDGCVFPLGIYAPTTQSLRQESWWDCACSTCTGLAR